MKRLNQIIIALSLMASFSATASLREGAYLGQHNGDDKINLLLKEVPGRVGSFFALLMKSEEMMSLYIVDELNHSSYAMTPLEITSDGEIGIVNEDPSLVISLSTGKKGQQIFKIMSSNSGNNRGFNGFFSFKGKKSKYTWHNFMSGRYKLKNNKNALQISDLDLTEREATAVLLTSTLSGTYIVREKFPHMFLLYKNSIFATGTMKDEIPSAIGIFLSKRGFQSKKMMILVNPKSDRIFRTFIKLKERK